MVEIDVSKALKQQGESFQYEYAGTPELKEIDLAEPLTIRAEYTVINDDGEIRIAGTYRAVVRAACVRCLDEVTCELCRPFDEIYTKNAGDDSYTYEGETVSLDKMIYDDITLNVPQHLLCSEGCKGLCQRCGVNLNRESCGCGENMPDDHANPFSKLKDLF